MQSCHRVFDVSACNLTNVCQVGRMQPHHKPSASYMLPSHPRTCLRCAGGGGGGGRADHAVRGVHGALLRAAPGAHATATCSCLRKYPCNCRCNHVLGLHTHSWRAQHPVPIARLARAWRHACAPKYACAKHLACAQHLACANARSSRVRDCGTLICS